MITAGRIITLKEESHVCFGNWKLSNSRYVLVGSLVLLLLAAFPLAAAAGFAGGASYSGDDAYDRAAGVNPDGDEIALACLPSATFGQ